MCLGDFSKDFTVDNMKKNGINGDINEFTVNYNTIYVTDIVDIHKYLTRKHNIKQFLNLLKKIFTKLLRFGESLASDHLKCISLNNQPFQVRKAHVRTSLLSI